MLSAEKSAMILETIANSSLASDEIKKGLLDRLAKAKAKAVNPWREASKPVHPMQFKDFVLPKDAEALIGSPS